MNNLAIDNFASLVIETAAVGKTSHVVLCLNNFNEGPCISQHY